MGESANKKPQGKDVKLVYCQPVSYNSKMSAFTVMEMLVVLVLSGIIIATSLQFYINYQQMVNHKSKQMDCGKEVLQFYHTFKHEFDNALLIKSAGYEITILQPSKIWVNYELEKDYITRSQNEVSDTFFIKVNDFNTTKDNITGLDKIIELELQNCGEVFPIRMVKEYPNDVLMNKSLKFF